MLVKVGWKALKPKAFVFNQFDLKSFGHYNFDKDNCKINKLIWVFSLEQHY